MAPGVEIKGLSEFRRELKAMGPEFPKELRVIHKDIADRVAADARSVASGMSRLQASAAPMIRGYATQREARVGFPGGTKAGAAFWGMRRHSGWYAGKPGPPQAPKWVGAGWEPGVAGQGPYAINDALARKVPDIVLRFERMIEDLAARAFPD